jgi:hypothetical protein
MRALFLLLTACSAPDLDEAPDRGPAPSPAELEAERAERAPSAPAPSAATPPGAPPPQSPPASPSATPPVTQQPAAAPTAPPPAVAPTAPEHMPAAPFTAWTTAAPTTLVGDHGQPTATLKRLGVRVEVDRVEGARVRVRCMGCTDADHDAEGWLHAGILRAAHAPGGTNGPLETALRLRAGWAGGRDLPDGATNAQLCALLDHGFDLSGDVATWSVQDGSATLQWGGQRWSLEALSAPTAPLAWTCRADGRPNQPAPSESP